jgi:hypothetical protein
MTSTIVLKSNDKIQFPGKLEITKDDELECYLFGFLKEDSEDEIDVVTHVHQEHFVMLIWSAEIIYPNQNNGTELEING